MACSLDYLLTNISRVTSIREMQIASPSGAEGRFAVHPKIMCPFELRPLSDIGINVGCSLVIDIALGLQVRKPAPESNHTHHTLISVNDKAPLFCTKEGLSSGYLHEIVAA